MPSPLTRGGHPEQTPFHGYQVAFTALCGRQVWKDTSLAFASRRLSPWTPGSRSCRACLKKAERFAAQKTFGSNHSEKEAIMSNRVIMEYSLDSGATWRHDRTVPKWVIEPGQEAVLKGQQDEVIDHAHDLSGYDKCRIIVRVLAEDDPRAEVNTPAGRNRVRPTSNDIYHVTPADTAHEATLQIGEVEVVFDPSSRASRNEAIATLARIQRAVAELEASLRVIMIAPEHAGLPADQK
uniref:hypothetical protein n=1 Tax=Nonomuraea sp. CA-251285 TaxID=3240002 RepID=UPI003F495960